MEKTKKTEARKQDEVEREEVNWPVVLPILLVMAAIILYVFLF